MSHEKEPDESACIQYENSRCLSFLSDTKGLCFFFGFLQQGFFVTVQTGISIKRMLCDRFGIESDYVENRIKTVFYDGRPVDNMETAIVKNGGTLALSAAMPGLVGATFRSGGVLAPFRASISYRPDCEKLSVSREGVLFMKLFNLLVPEIGPGFLRKGIFIEKELVDSFLKNQRQEFWDRCRSVLLDDHPADPEKLAKDGVPAEDRMVLLKVTTESS